MTVQGKQTTEEEKREVLISKKQGRILEVNVGKDNKSQTMCKILIRK